MEANAEPTVWAVILHINVLWSITHYVVNNEAEEGMYVCCCNSFVCCGQLCYMRHAYVLIIPLHNSCTC